MHLWLGEFSQKMKPTCATSIQIKKQTVSAPSSNLVGAAATSTRLHGAVV